MRALALALALIVTVPGASALTLLTVEAPEAGEVIVGYHHGEIESVLSLVRTLGGTVLRQDEDLRIAVVSTSDTAGFILSVLGGEGVDYAETNDRTRIAGAQWNGAQWNGAQWNGAQWNGAQWNGAQWNADGDVTSDPGTGFQWGLTAVRAHDAWDASMGTRGAKLCVLDSGLAWDHRDIEPNAWTGVDGERGYNAIDPRESAYDDAGHGTHVAGVAAAAVDNQFGIAGVGNVQIVPVKVLGADGTGLEDDLAIGLAWCANHGADVALMALGVDDDGPTVRNAIEYARDRDVLLVASAGNDGCDGCVGYPARHEDVIAVAALAPDLSRAPFSARGSQVDLAAPGVDIIGPFPDGRFVFGSGTSQAAAFVAGAAALVRDAHPELSAREARERIEGAATDMGSPSSFGHGALQVEDAMKGV